VTQSPRAFCRELSIAAQETIAGSAAAATPFIVALEHVAPWGAKAIAESALSDAVKAKLGRLEKDVHGTRPQLIKREVATPRGVTLLMAGVEPKVQRCVRWTLDQVEDLVDIDFVAAAAALRAGDPVDGARDEAEPQLLVCTNGKRDACCAKWGMPLYRGLSGLHTATWETTHLGGHRFAATLLCLPTGICLGRVELSEGPALVEAVRARRIPRLDRLRGRVSATAAEQFAEAAWRARQPSPTLAVDAITEISSEQVDKETARVTLVDAMGAAHELTVQQYASGLQARPSCAKAPADVMRWRVVG
jgi:hypothetical protein